MTKVAKDRLGSEGMDATLDTLAREGARRMIAAALEAEVEAYLARHRARLDGTKEIIAIEDGYRESKESWLSLLRDLRDRGMQAPVLAVGDGALGFWGALSEVFPATLEQRCWFHKLGNVLDKLPKSVQPKAKSALHEIMNAPHVRTR